jgi:Ser/Thr protein kinase RdoA (MazF antagonist)
MTPHSRPSLDREELRAAVRAYGLRGPVQFEPIGRGASASAKGRLRTPDGDFMLKRRSARTWSTERASFLHRFQEHLFAAGVPVARLARTATGDHEFRTGAGAFELFHWVEGDRWSRGVVQAAAAGLALGRALRAAEGFDARDAPPRTSFHRPGGLAGAGVPVLEAVMRADPDTDQVALRRTLQRIVDRAMSAERRADEAGIAESPMTCGHGDVHPGNALYRRDRVVAILDFDSAGIDRRACEVANAALHFSNAPIAGVEPSAWVAEPDFGLARAVVDGCNAGLGDPLLAQEAAAIPWLMIEACTVESLVPLARSGRFARLRADRFLDLIDRKTAAIESWARSLPR